MLSRILIFSLLLSIELLSQSNVENLSQQINTILNDEFFNQSQIAIEIYDLTNDQTLYSRNNKLLLHPASNMKLLTSAAGLIFLGDDYNFKTSIYYSGEITNTALFGDLYVKGGLDPDFTIEDLDSLVHFIKSLGIKYITNNLYADISNRDSLYWGNGWMWDDDPAPGVAFLSALNVCDNSIEVFVEGNEVGSPGIVILIPKTDYVTIENHSVTVSSTDSTKLEITRDWVNSKNNIFITGQVANGPIIDSSDHKEKLNVLEPEKYFLTLFKEHLQKENISLFGNIKIGDVPKSSVQLISINSGIDSVIINLNKKSDNLSAEMLLYALAVHDSGAPGTAENGLQEIKNFVDSLGLNPDDYSFADGSGVSRYNLVNAELLVELLKYMYKTPYFNLFYNSLPVAGIDGTLEKRMIDSKAQDNVHAKTGTIQGVSTLSGYVTSAEGDLIAFSILIQNFVEKTKVARDFQDRICELLANYK